VQGVTARALGVGRGTDGKACIKVELNNPPTGPLAAVVLRFRFLDATGAEIGDATYAGPPAKCVDAKASASARADKRTVARIDVDVLDAQGDPSPAAPAGTDALSPGQRVDGPGYHGIVEKGGWQPTAADIVVLEKLLGPRLAADKPKQTYFRGYSGAGPGTIVVELSCRGIPDGTTKMGGGDCFGIAVIDLAGYVISSLTWNDAR
jgi:hypothetical protein